MDIYVGNLPYSIEEDEIRSAFAEFGDVESVKIVLDRETGRPRGFAFVRMPNADEGTNAIERLDGADLAGRPLKVNEARPREDRPPRQFEDRGGFRGGPPHGGGQSRGGFRDGGGGGGGGGFDRRRSGHRGGGGSRRGGRDRPDGF